MEEQKEQLAQSIEKTINEDESLSNTFESINKSQNTLYSYTMPRTCYIRCNNDVRCVLDHHTKLYARPPQ
jgi:chromosome segregation ATPase